MSATRPAPESANDALLPDKDDWIFAGSAVTHSLERT
jgi:hypothetical protein